MPQLIDLALLRQMTHDAMGVYEANLRSAAVCAEAEQARQAAETLLAEVTRAYLPAGVQITDLNEPGAPRRELIKSYIEVQRAYAELKDALYLLMEAHRRARDWCSASHAVNVLARLDGTYRDVAALKPRLELEALVDEKIAGGQYAQAVEALLHSMPPELTPNNDVINRIDEINKTASGNYAIQVGRKNVPLVWADVKGNIYENKFAPDLAKNWNSKLHKHETVGKSSLLAEKPGYPSLASISLLRDLSGRFFRLWMHEALLTSKSSSTIIGYIVEN